MEAFSTGPSRKALRSRPCSTYAGIPKVDVPVANIFWIESLLLPLKFSADRARAVQSTRSRVEASLLLQIPPRWIPRNPLALRRRPHNRRRHHIRRERPNRPSHHVRRTRARRHAKNCVPIKRCMRRINSPPIAVMRHLRHFRRFILGQLRVRRHHPNRRVRSLLRDNHAVSAANCRHRVAKPLPIFRPRASHNLPSPLVVNISYGIHRHQRRHHNSRIPHLDACRPNSRLHRKLRPEHFSNRRSRSRAHISFLHLVAGRRFARLISRFRRRPDFPVAHSQIKQNRRRHNRHHHRRPHAIPNSLLIQVAHHSRRSIEPKRAPAAQRQPINLLHRINRPQQIRLARSRRASAHIHASRRALLAQNHRASRWPPRLRPVPNLQSLHVRQTSRVSIRRSKLSRRCPTDRIRHQLSSGRASRHQRPSRRHRQRSTEFPSIHLLAHLFSFNSPARPPSPAPAPPNSLPPTPPAPSKSQSPPAAKFRSNASPSHTARPDPPQSPKKYSPSPRLRSSAANTAP